MDKDKFVGLVSRMEGSARISGGFFKLRFFLIILLEFFYLFIGAGVLLALSYLGIAVHENFFSDNEWLSEIFFAIFGTMLAIGFLSALYPFWAIFSSFRVKTSVPTDLALTKETAPKIFALLDQLKLRFSGPEIQEVQLNESMDLSIIRVFKFGILSPSKNYLLIGAPLLSFLTPEEFEAKVAYEYRLFIGTEGSRFGVWIHRVNEVLSGNKPRTFDKFFAYFIAFHRNQIYEADRSAAEIVGTSNIAKLLTIESIRDSILNTYWDHIDSNPRVVSGIYAGLSKARSLSEQSYLQSLMQEVISESSSERDRRPCLRDRISALKEEPLLDSNDQNALEKYMNPVGVQFIRTMDENWKAELF